MSTVLPIAEESSTLDRVQALESEHLLQTYARYPLVLDRGKACYVSDPSGKRYLDFITGIGVNALGHAHPHLVEAITEQAKKLWHVSNLYRIPESERLADRLCAASFADLAFFCNSGAEAMELSIKMARKFQSASGKPDRTGPDASVPVMLISPEKAWITLSYDGSIASGPCGPNPLIEQ